MPRRVRPRLPPEWHVPEDPRLWITWVHANRNLTKEGVYWVSTSSLEGKPHAAPVWGIWKRNSFFFETAPDSVKGRNLLSNPLIVVHVQDGLDTVIVEGTAARHADRNDLASLARDYVRKYDYSPDWSDESKQVVFKVTPKIAHAWKAPRMHRTLVNFLF
jgi:general stress protein 26